MKTKTRPSILDDCKIVDLKNVRRILLDDHAIKRPRIENAAMLLGVGRRQDYRLLDRLRADRPEALVV